MSNPVRLIFLLQEIYIKTNLDNCKKRELNLNGPPGQEGRHLQKKLFTFGHCPKRGGELPNPCSNLFHARIVLIIGAFLLKRLPYSGNAQKQTTFFVDVFPNTHLHCGAVSKSNDYARDGFWKLYSIDTRMAHSSTQLYQLFQYSRPMVQLTQ